VFDFVTASVLLPINALLIALFSGWVIAGSALQRELAMKHDVFFTVWQVLMRYIAPVAVLVILISGFIQ
jgi:NSS family neurotransmitter:Na+ symporter